MSARRRSPGRPFPGRALLVVALVVVLVAGVAVWANRGRLGLGGCPAPVPGDEPQSPAGPVSPPTTAPGGRPVTVTGTIVDGACDGPIEDAVVWVVRADDPTALVVAARTDPDGRFSVIVPADRYRFTMQDGHQRNYVSRWYPDSADDAGSQVVDVTGDLTLNPIALYRVADMPAAPYDGPVPGRRAAVIGDSLVQQSTTPIHRALEGTGPVSVVGIAGQRTDQMQPVAQRYRDTHPDTVVIALGNNDLLQGHSARDTLDALGNMVDRFPKPVCAVLVNLTTHSANGDFNRRAAELDAGLPQLAAERPWLRIADWNAEVERMLAENSNGRAWFTDGLHMERVAMPRYGRVMADTAATC